MMNKCQFLTGWTSNLSKMILVPAAPSGSVSSLGILIPGTGWHSPRMPGMLTGAMFYRKEIKAIPGDAPPRPRTRVKRDRQTESK